MAVAACTQWTDARCPSEIGPGVAEKRGFGAVLESGTISAVPDFEAVFERARLQPRRKLTKPRAPLGAEGSEFFSNPLRNLAHKSASGRCLVPDNPQRQHDQVILSRLDSAKIEPLNNRNILAQKNLMSPRFGGPEFLR